MNEIQDHRNPTEVADYFSSVQRRYGFKFDYSLESLEKEVDRFLIANTGLSPYMQTVAESLLTAYVGESVCRLYNGKWCGQYHGPIDLYGANFYTCWIEINDFKYWPSHFIEYYLSNGIINEGSFYNYLYNRDHSKGVFADFLGGGLLNKVNAGKTE